MMTAASLEQGETADSDRAEESWLRALATAPVFHVLGLTFLLALATFETAAGDRWLNTLAATAPLLDPWYEVTTAAYVHLDWMHWFNNAVMILVFGTAVAYTTTTLRFHFFFVLTGTAAVFAQFLASNYGAVLPTAVLGSSGAAFALLGYAVGAALAGAFSFFGKKMVLFILGGIAAGLTLYLSPEGSGVIGHFVGVVIGLFAGRFRVLSWRLRPD